MQKAARILPNGEVERIGTLCGDTYDCDGCVNVDSERGMYEERRDTHIELFVGVS